MFEVWDFNYFDFDTWNEYIKKSDGIVNLFFYSKFNVRMPII